MKKICRRTKSARSSWWPFWLLHVTYPKMSFLPTSLDLDDHQRPPNTLMVCGAKNYTRNITLVHQNSMWCIKIMSGTSPSDVSSNAWKRTWWYQVIVLPPKLSWLHVRGRSISNLLWNIFSEVLIIWKRSCGLMNPPFNASPTANIGHFSAKMDTWILPETSC